MSKYKLLKLAILTDDLPTATYILEKDPEGITLDAPGYPFYQSFLHLAVWKNSLPMVKLLLKHGCDPNVKTRQRHTAFSIAIRKSLEITDNLIFKKEFLTKNKYDPAILRVLLQHDPVALHKKVTQVDGVPKSLLALAHKAKNKAAIQILQELGATDSTQASPIPKRNSHNPLFDGSKAAAYEQLYKKYTSKISRVFHRQKDPKAHEEALFYAALRQGDVAAVEFLLYHGYHKRFPLNKVRGSFYIPLQIAASKGDLSMVQLLLDYGAQADLVSWGGGTALLCATQANNLPLVRFLLTYDTTVVDTMFVYYYKDKRITLFPLWVAVSKDNIQITQALLDAGADINFIPILTEKIEWQ